LQYDLEAIRSSRVRVVFLLASCAADHVILSHARRMNMLKGYAWVIMQPTALCPLGERSPSQVPFTFTSQ
jgi:hypothetical protein